MFAEVVLRLKSGCVFDVRVCWPCLGHGGCDVLAVFGYGFVWYCPPAGVACVWLFPLAFLGGGGFVWSWSSIPFVVLGLWPFRVRAG